MLVLSLLSKDHEKRLDYSLDYSHNNVHVQRGGVVTLL